MVLLVCCVGSLCYVMCMSITRFLNHGSFAGSLRDGGEKKKKKMYLVFPITPKLSDFQIEKNKDT